MIGASRPAGIRLVLGLAIALAAGAAASARDVGAGGDWDRYAGDNGFTKYSRLSQIDAGNVATLQVAWRWSSPDNAITQANVTNADGQVARPAGFRTTPLEAGGVIYARTSFSMAVAIDATTGKTLWTFDPETYRRPRPAIFGHVGRGLALWTVGGKTRVMLLASDGRLFALDAVTGKPVATFGQDGVADAGALMRFAGSDRPVPPGVYGFTATPAICGGTVIFGQVLQRGGTQPDAALKYPIHVFPEGDVFGFDATTGKLRWTFHGSPRPGQAGRETWKTPSEAAHGKANVWTMISCDDDTATAYLPVAAASGVVIGRHRPGDNLYSQSLVAVDARSGRPRWHFQLSHHDIWDYDPPAAPILFDARIDGRDVKGVAQVGKTAFTYVFDRVTGKPVWPIEERPVPPSPIPGEIASPTQPFPTRPAPFDVQAPITDDKVIDLTPKLKADALAFLAEHGRGEMFQPLGPKGVLILPGIGGGANWGGGAFDPETSYLFVPSMTVPQVMGLADVVEGAPGYNRLAFNLRQAPGEVPNAIPPTKPPYTRVTAIDMKSGDIVWQAANGRGFNKHPALAGLDLPPLGSNGIAGILATKTLVFSADRGRTAGEGGASAPAQIRAFDKRTGRVVWEHDLPCPYWGASPMTYEQAGRQYLVIACGGIDNATPERPGPPQELIAFALPK